MLADAFFIWRCCRVAGIVFTVLSVQPSAFTAICFGRTVDTFKHDKLPPDHLSIIIKDRLVREFIMLEFEVGQRIGIVRILKHWNIQKNYRGIVSFELERKIAEYAYFSCTSYTDYLKYALEKIKYPTNCVNKALDCIAEALRLEADGYPYSAESKIKEAFPEV